MINTTVIYTNIILRYLLNDHEAHFEVAKTFMLEVKAGNLFAYIPDSVLAECIFVLLKVYKIPKSDICEKLAKICTYTGIIESNREILSLSLALYSKHNVDIVDAIVHATAQCQKWEKISFDHDMKKFT